VAAGRLQASLDPVDANKTDLTMICVGTPGRPDGSLDTSQVETVARQIGNHLRLKPLYHSIVVRSTLLPGTTRRTLVPLIERASGKRADSDFGIAYFPEFMREGSAIADHDSPGAIIIGVEQERSATRLREVIAGADRPCRLLTLTGAELLKCANNAWHALKISFANELGVISKQLGLDGHDIMEAICLDAKLNISPAYLEPGFAFGGSCLPKDVRGLIHTARMADLATPVLDSVPVANEAQIDRALGMIVATGKERIGIIGLPFKEDTDDLRLSPLVILAERLLARGLAVRIHAPTVSLARIKGSNLRYLREHLPRIEALLCEDRDTLFATSDVIVVGSKRRPDELLERLDASGRLVIDLARLDRRRTSGGAYEGLCW
jgi:GDP-mannose 6-dehydrogenase